jgi:hypothetical protein
MVAGYEFKWSDKAKARKTKTFTRHYETAIKVIHRQNFREFVIIR